MFRDEVTLKNEEIRPLVVHWGKKNQLVSVKNHLVQQNPSQSYKRIKLVLKQHRVSSKKKPSQFSDSVQTHLDL